MNLFIFLGIPMVLFILQLQMCLVDGSWADRLSCENAGWQYRNAGCAKRIRKVPQPGAPWAWYWEIGVIPPPWKTDHYECTKESTYTIKACCGPKVEALKPGRDTWIAGICRNPDGSPIRL
ncbi:hypothetical protein PGT21_008366 [Puccinia graminis f. sp. tritici]|uniref:Uncharacterized protein n=1 Tax=Puccinia graminis f. sp. tritici TaxID=56615 RepID=A0A5B0RC71_PUCGR|nr:hypothetical protein PGT21_008366 [Puccinia graminis f. sp. tritici]KAA1123267.1 hypothetical protein PGTUg99_017977 [Puccinia graminis f. sp. tritici]